MCQIELRYMCMLVDSFRRGVYIFAAGRTADSSPLQSRFVAFFELVFVTEDDLRQIRQRQPEIDPCASGIEMQVLIQVKGRRGKRPIITSSIVIVPAPFFKSAPHESQVGLPQLEFDSQVILRE